MAQATAASGADPAWAGEIAAHPVPDADPDRTTNSTIDAGGVKKQKEPRATAAPPGVPEPPPAAASGDESPRYVHNTSLPVQKREATYRRNGPETVATLRVRIALLGFNDLLRSNRVFFVDGQRTRPAAIVKALPGSVKSRSFWTGLICQGNVSRNGASPGRAGRFAIAYWKN